MHPDPESFECCDRLLVRSVMLWHRMSRAETHSSAHVEFDTVL